MHHNPMNNLETKIPISQDTTMENLLNLSMTSSITEDSSQIIGIIEKELIYDFYYQFCSDNTFQLSRIKFPLKIISSDNNINYIEKKDWKHDYLFFSLQYATHIIEDNRSDLDYSADYGDYAIFSWIYPLLYKKKDYYFIRENNKWFLSRIETNTLKSNDSENFINFLFRFMNDSSFQISRTKFPFKINTWTGTEEESKDTTYFKVQSQWSFISLYNGLDSLTNFSNDLNSEIKDRNNINVMIQGVENGIAMTYRFQKIDNLWFFVELEDNSD